MTAKVSVIMATFDNAAYIETAVASLAAQTLPDWELIVVDDASTDGTDAIVARLAAADQRIRRYRNEVNLGYCPSRNLAIRESRGPYIAILDSDDERKPESLERQAALLDANPHVVLVGTGCEWCDERLVRQNDRLYPLTDREIRRKFLRYSPFCIPSMMFRASALDDPAFDVDLYPADDIELPIRLGRKGELANLPETLYRLRTHAASTSQSRARAQERKTFAVRRKAVREYGCRPTAGDIAWNIAQAASMYLMPGSWRFRLFNWLRSSD